jgi:hypothetical protein
MWEGKDLSIPCPYSIRIKKRHCSRMLLIALMKRAEFADKGGEKNE